MVRPLAPTRPPCTPRMAVPGPRRANAWLTCGRTSTDAGRRRDDGHTDLQRHGPWGNDGHHGCRGCTDRAEYGEECHVVQFYPDEQHTQQDPHEGHVSHLRRKL